MRKKPAPANCNSSRERIVQLRRELRLLGGYTLIEILIVIVIMGLLFAVGYANYRDFSRQQAVTSAMRALRADLRLAQEQAIEGKKPPGCTGTLTGYKFTVANNLIYQISAYCTGGDIVVKTISLPSGITIGTPVLNPIVFNVLGTGTNISQAIPGRVVIGLTQTATNYFRSVIVYPSGEVKESTETPDATATPTPTPTPAPPTWHYLGGWSMYNGITIPISVNAQEFTITMWSGGGADGRISYFDCWGSGLRFNYASGSIVANTGAGYPFPNAITIGQSAVTTFLATPVAFQSISAGIGTCDGESAWFGISYYGP